MSIGTGFLLLLGIIIVCFGVWAWKEGMSDDGAEVIITLIGLILLAVALGLNTWDTKTYKPSEVAIASLIDKVVVQADDTLKTYSSIKEQNLIEGYPSETKIMLKDDLNFFNGVVSTSIVLIRK